MGPLGWPELLIIFVVALIVFGPRKLPQLGKSLGRAMGEFRRATNELKNSLEAEVSREEEKLNGPRRKKVEDAYARRAGAGQEAPLTDAADSKADASAPAGETGAAEEASGDLRSGAEMPPAEAAGEPSAAAAGKGESAENREPESVPRSSDEAERG